MKNKLLVTFMAGLLSVLSLNAMDKSTQGNSLSQKEREFEKAIADKKSTQVVLLLKQDDGALGKKYPLARELTYVAQNKRHDPRRFDLSGRSDENVVALNHVIGDLAVAGNNLKFVHTYNQLLQGQHPEEVHPAIQNEFKNHGVAALEDLHDKYNKREPKKWQDNQDDDDI